MLATLDRTVKRYAFAHEGRKTKQSVLLRNIEA